MTYGQYIGNSISPVTQHSAAIPEAQSNGKELVESEELRDSEVTPVPEAHEEVRQPRIGRRLMAPTRAEIDEHYPLHLNYRSCCEHCRAGKARQGQHLVEPHDRERLEFSGNTNSRFFL